MQNIGCVHITYNWLLIRKTRLVLHKDINNVRLYRIRRFSATQYRLYAVRVDTLRCASQHKIRNYDTINSSLQFFGLIYFIAECFVAAVWSETIKTSSIILCIHNLWKPLLLWWQQQQCYFE